jgi:hypothetical protein
MRARPALPLAFALLAALHVVAVLCVLCVLGERTARADGPYDGAWNMSPLSESFTVQQWSAACGPPPVSGTAVPGGPVTITGSGGELVISGARTLRTDQCLDPLPTLARNVHSQDGSSWRTRCATPAADPRHAVVNTAYFASGTDSISVAETGRYEFTINDAHCIADVRRAGSISRVQAAAPAPTPTAAATPVVTTTAATPPPPITAPSPRVDCSSPGDPATLQVRPSRKLLKAGDSFAFHGAVLDAAGCAAGTSITWTVGAVTFKDGQAHAGLPTVDASGKVAVPSQDFGDATFDVVATAAGRSAHASVEVAIPADYDALLAQSGLDSNGELDAPAVAVLATSSIGAADAKAQDSARKRRLLFIGVIGGMVLVLGGVAVIGARRAARLKGAEAAAQERHAEKMKDFERQKGEREAQHAAQMKAHRESVALAQQQSAAQAARGIDTGPVYCPSCRREFPAGTAFCAFDSNRLVAIRGHEQLMAGPAGGICTVCRKGFNPGVKVCPEHGEELVPAAVAGAGAAAQTPNQRGKICPSCGGRFEGGSTFCARDGTQLVLLN